MIVHYNTVQLGHGKGTCSYRKVSAGTNITKTWLSFCLMDCVRLARYSGNMYSSHIFSIVSKLSQLKLGIVYTWLRNT